MKDWPPKTALFFVVVAIGGMAILVWIPWARVFGLERFDVGVSRSSDLRPLFLTPFKNGEGRDGIVGIQDRIEQAVLREVPVGTPLKDVERHIHRHFTDPNLEPSRIWSGSETWSYRLDAVLHSAFPGTATFTLSYTFRNDTLEAVSAYYSYAAL